MNLTIGTLNLNGLKQKKRQEVFTKYLKASGFDILAVQEVDTSRVCGIEASGYSFLSTSGSFDTGFFLKQDIAVDPENFKFEEDGTVCSLQIESITLINVHMPSGSNNIKARADFIQNIIPRYVPVTGCKLLMGDFNCVAREEDVQTRTGTSLKKRVSEDLKSLVKAYDLTDMWILKKKNESSFTRIGNQGASRIDRIYISREMEKSVNSIQHEHVLFSDHYAVRASIGDVNRKTSFMRASYWKLHPDTIKDKGNKEIIREKIQKILTERQQDESHLTAWIKFKEHIVNFLKYLQKESERERLAHERFLRKVLSQLKDEIDQNTGDPIFEYHEIRRQLKEIEQKKFENWTVKNRLNDLYEGEQISLATILKAKRKREESKIDRIKTHDGKITDDHEEIKKTVYGFFSELYKWKERAREANAFDDFEVKRKVSKDENEMLSQPITEDELKQALSSTKTGKAPGRDGLSYDFYKVFFSEISEIMLSAMNEIIREGATPDQTLAIITLVPKKGDMQHIENWRPISLLPCDTRLCSKVLMNRLRKLMGEILGETQHGGIKGRKVQHILAILRDLLLRREELSESSLKWVLTCVDFIKAFDSVVREVLWELMTAKYSFCGEFVVFYKNLYRGAAAKVVVNGSLTEEFPLEISLRQGDPSSSFLFEIYLDPLIKYIEARITGIRVLPTLVLKSEVFVDDGNFFADGVSDIKTVMRGLEWYEKNFAVRTHKKKSKILPLTKSAKASWIRSLEKETWLEVSPTVKTLGVEFSVRGNCWQNAWEKKVLEIQCLLCGEDKGRNLSLFQRSTFVNMYCVSRILYLAPVIPLPEPIAKKIETYMWRFIWSGKLEKLSKKLLFCTKESGGLGVLDFRKLCQNMLARMTLEFLNGPQEHFQMTREWLVPLLNNPSSTNSDTNVPIFMKDSFPILKQLQEKGLLMADSREIKTQITRILTPKEENNGYHVKEKELFVNFENAFRNLHSFPMEPKVRELMFQVIHMILPYRNRVSRFLRNEDKNALFVLK